MKELDFDELDRAVNSLMTEVPKTDAPRIEEKEKTLDLTTLSVTDDPKKPSPAPTPLLIAAPPLQKKPVSRAPLGSRRAGRFMDVVHPSSDMKKPEQPRPASRQGITVAPRTTFGVPAEAALSATGLSPEKVGSSPPSLSVVDEPPVVLNEWPDPLEMADFKQTPTDKEPSLASEIASATAGEKEASIPTYDEGDQSPLASPFLPDTKVEKRPLGISVTSPAEEPDHTPVISNDEIKKTVSDPNAQLPAIPKDVEPILPEELHSDLVAIEADTTTEGVPKTDEVQPASEKKPIILEKEPAEEVSKPPATEHEPSVVSGPSSIPQQYREEPSSGDQKNGAIYDTDTYHQPLAHPAKKKPDWLWVVWIAIILLVGAGGGAAIYVFSFF